MEGLAMKAYSIDLRERVLADCDGGMNTQTVATKYRVSKSWVRRLKQRRRENGEVTPRSSRNGKQPKWLPYAEQLQSLVREQPDATLEELRHRLDVTISAPTLCRALRALQLTFKKSPEGVRTGSPRHCRAAGRLARPATWAESPTTGVSRRNMGQDEHGSPAWPKSARRATGCQSPSRSLEDDDLYGGVAL
jgi:transposase